MKCLILNSGTGTRMGEFTRNFPKCMTLISKDETILSRQLRLLLSQGINEVVITTGYKRDVLIRYCESLNLPMNIIYVHNSKYESTNYIVSMLLAKKYLENQSILLMHGDLVFEKSVLELLVSLKRFSHVVTSSTIKVNEKDFNAQLRGERILSISTQLKNDAVSAQPLYKLMQKDWQLWMKQISSFVAAGKVNVYAEDALNSITSKMDLYAFDIKNALCLEVDTTEDLLNVRKRLK